MWLLFLGVLCSKILCASDLSFKELKELPEAISGIASPNKVYRITHAALLETNNPNLSALYTPGNIIHDDALLIVRYQVVYSVTENFSTG